MAHRIVGLDVGYRSVKAAVIDKSMRQTSLVRVDREPIALPGDEEAIRAALSKLLARCSAGSDDVIATGLPLGLCVHRVLSFPFDDDKALREAVGFELESHIPLDPEELIIDHAVVGKRDDETDVLTVGAPRGVVTDRLELLRSMGAEPRSLGVASLSYATLLAHLPSLARGRSLVLDIGALETEAVLVEQGRVRWARSLSIGSDAVRESFASGFATEGVRGDLLQTHCLLLPSGVPPAQPAEQILHSATVEALLPWLRELRQSLAATLRGGGPRPDRVVLTGGMAKLRGLHEYLEQVLRMPVAELDLSELEIDAAGVGAEGGDCGLAVALAMQRTELRKQDALDFRQDDLAYEGDYKYLQRRVPQIAAFFVIALCLLGVRTTITYRGLVQDRQRQRAQLTRIGKALTSRRIRSFSRLKREMRRGLEVDLAGYYPDITAIHAFEELSRIIDKVTEPPDYKGEVPSAPGARPPGPRPPSPPGGIPVGLRAHLRPADGPGGTPRDLARPDGEGGAGEFTGHKVELLSVGLDRTKGSLRGDCDTQDALLAFQEAITHHRCFSKVKSSSDRITFQRHRGWFRFTIRFEIGCPDDGTTGSGKRRGRGRKGVGKPESTAAVGHKGRGGGRRHDKPIGADA